MGKKRSWQTWLWYFTLIGALVVLYKICGDLGQVWQAVLWILGVLTPFIAGFAIAFILLGPTRRLEKRFLKQKGKCWNKLARPLSIAIVYILLLGLVALVIWLVIPQLINSITGLVKSLPDYLTMAQKRMEDFSRPGGLLDRFHLANRMDDIYQSIVKELKTLVSTENVVTALKGVVSATTSLVDAVIAFIVSVYMLSGREQLMRHFHAVLALFVKDSRIQTVDRYAHRIARIFYRYLYGSITDALIVGVIASIGLSLFRVPYAILLGMALGLMNMIPYFGSTVGGIGISLITLLSKNIYAALGVALYIIVLQQLDGNIIEPHIVGGSVGIRPIYVLLGIVLFGGLFGFWGIFLGAPLMAVVQMFIKDAITKKKAASTNAEPAGGETAL